MLKWVSAVFALVLGLTVPCYAQQAASVEPVGQTPELDWAFLNDGARFGPELAHFDDNDPDFTVDDSGLKHLQQPDVVAAVLGGDKAANVNDLLVLITLSPEAALQGVRVSLNGGAGPSVELSASDAVQWAAAFGSNPIAGLQSIVGFDRTLGSVLGAAIRYQNGLAAQGAGSGAVLETIRIEFLGMEHGVAKIDFLGIDANGKIAYNSTDGGGAIYGAPAFTIGGVNLNAAPAAAVPEPGPIGVALAALLAGLVVARRSGGG